MAVQTCPTAGGRAPHRAVVELGRCYTLKRIGSLGAPHSQCSAGFTHIHGLAAVARVSSLIRIGRLHAPHKAVLELARWYTLKRMGGPGAQAPGETVNPIRSAALASHTFTASPPWVVSPATSSKLVAPTHRAGLCWS